LRGGHPKHAELIAIRFWVGRRADFYTAALNRLGEFSRDVTSIDAISALT
jgi:hypothetical protein